MKDSKIFFPLLVVTGCFVSAWNTDVFVHPKGRVHHLPYSKIRSTREHRDPFYGQTRRDAVHSDSDLETGTAQLETTELYPIEVPWLIVGGGIHGVHVAARLASTFRKNQPSIQKNPTVSPPLIIVDPHEHLLQAWKSRTEATGMNYLRSSVGYHLDLDEMALRNFNTNQDQPIPQMKQTGKKRRRKKRPTSKSKHDPSKFAADYQRPRLDFFNEHCDSVIDAWNLDQYHIQGSVTDMQVQPDCVQVVVSESNNDSSKSTWRVYKAQHVVLALGSDVPEIPDWVSKDLQESGIVQHILDDTLHLDTTTSASGPTVSQADKCEKIVIVGTGISAGHKALQLLASKSCREIHLIGRQPTFLQQQFDTHQDWMMDQAAAKRSLKSGGSGLPNRQKDFAATTSWQERRAIIGRERIPGTVTRPVHQGLQQAIQDGAVQWHPSTEVVSCQLEDPKRGSNSLSCAVKLSTGEVLEGIDKIVLATGFQKGIPGGQLVQNSLVGEAGLPVSSHCGFPVINQHLQWHPRIYVSGALAELEVGPSARNIAGARIAAERILGSLE